MRRIYYCVFAAFLLGCAPQQSLSESEIETLKAEVLQATIARNSAYEAADADLAFSYFSRAPGTIEAVDGNYRNITNETLEGMKTFYDGVERGKIDIGTPQIEILGSESAMVFIEGTWSFIMKKTEQEIGSPFVMTLVWLKEDGAWKVFHKHESTPEE